MLRPCAKHCYKRPLMNEQGPAVLTRHPLPRWHDGYHGSLLPSEQPDNTSCFTERIFTDVIGAWDKTCDNPARYFLRSVFLLTLKRAKAKILLRNHLFFINHWIIIWNYWPFPLRTVQLRVHENAFLWPLAQRSIVFSYTKLQLA